MHKLFQQRQVPPAAENRFGFGNAALGLLAKTFYTVFTDADDAEPASGLGGFALSRHDGTPYSDTRRNR